MNPITVIGDPAAVGGAYLLRLWVAAPLAVAFGRFCQGRPLPIPPGEMMYVGSARRGLAARLLRHASRSGDRPAQPLRAAMLAEFPALGLADRSVRPPAGKKLHWHIDYLLQETAVSLTHALLIRSPLRLEARLGQWLNAQPETGVIAPGLGARDVAGGTHLLTLNAGPAWWDALPGRVAAILLNESPGLQSAA